MTNEKLISVYCQEECPIGKHCKFGEVYPDGLPVHAKYKCTSMKPKRTVEIRIPKKD